MASSPSALVDRLVQQRVQLLLKDNRRVSGRLVGCDEHMNVVLDGAEETSGEQRRHLGRIIVRGSNVLALNAPDGLVAKSP